MKSCLTLSDSVMRPATRRNCTEGISKFEGSAGRSHSGPWQTPSRWLWKRPTLRQIQTPPTSSAWSIIWGQSRTVGSGSGRVAKFKSKVGSRRRTTKIRNLVVHDIFFVALILIPYNMRLFLSTQNDIFVGNGRAWNKSSKNVYG